MSGVWQLHTPDGKVIEDGNPYGLLNELQRIVDPVMLVYEQGTAKGRMSIPGLADALMRDPDAREVIEAGLGLDAELDATEKDNRDG